MQPPIAGNVGHSSGPSRRREVPAGRDGAEAGRKKQSRTLLETIGSGPPKGRPEQVRS